MATPMSDATSPSPPMSFKVHPRPLSPATDASKDVMVDKFMARVKISQVSRLLRAKLLLASYKAAHNVGHVPLAVLEAQIPSRSPQPLLPPSSTASRSNAAKRKLSAAPGNSLAQQPSTSHAPTRNNSLINGFGSTHSDTTHLPQSPSLFTSILAPPPASQARTIFNASDPPIPAPVRPQPSSVSRSIAEGTRAHAKTHDSTHRSSRVAKSSTITDSPKRKGKRPAKTDLQPRPAKRSRGNHNNDQLDMEAAATLTSLLLHSQRGAGVASPRSSIDAGAVSDGTGAQHQQSFSSFPQSQSQPRLTAARASGARTPPGSRTPAANVKTPRPVTTEKDNEAADLMLFLATSPSPARGSNQSKDAKDMAAFRALGGGAAASKKPPPGRVLFPGELAPPRQIIRGGDGSYHSSVSSIGSDMGSHGSMNPLHRNAPSRLHGSGGGSPPHGSSQGQKPSSRLSVGAGSQLLAPPPHVGSPPRSVPAPAPAPDFNFSEYINASPAASPARKGSGTSGGSLRADVGRKLFEEEMGRSGRGSFGGPGPFAPVGTYGGPPMPAPPRRGSGERLAAGIELGIGGRP